MKKARWKLPAINIICLTLWAFACVIAGQVIVSWPIYYIFGAEIYEQPVCVAIRGALYYVVSLLLLILVPMFLFKKWKVSRTDLGLKELPTWTDIGLAPVGYIVAFLFSIALTTFFQLFPWFDAAAKQDIGFGPELMGLERAIAFTATCIIAPIAEEIIFRGWLYGLLRKKTSSILTSIWSMVLSSLLVSVLFGLIHFQLNVAVDVFALSLVLCALREITGTIYAGILVHILKNSIAFFLIYVFHMA